MVCNSVYDDDDNDDDMWIVQEPFPSVNQPKVHRPVVGDSLTLHCQPPYGYPPGVVYWGEFRSGDKLKPIENDDRVSLDYRGMRRIYCNKICIYKNRFVAIWSLIGLLQLR